MTGWAPIAASDELAGGHIVEALFEGRSLALWRDSAGAAHAWPNRCPHRGVLLSLGTVDGDSLVCRYHGWRFSGADGRCTRIPAHPGLAPPASVRIEALALREAAGLIWCSNDPEAAFIAPEPGILTRPLPFTLGLPSLRGALLGALPGASAVGDIWMRANLPHALGGWPITLLLRRADAHETWLYGLIHATPDADLIALRAGESHWMAAIRRQFGAAP